MSKWISFVAVIVALGCAPVTQPTQTANISDGQINVYNNSSVSGIINCEPNYGPKDTPVTITITISQGASRVAGIFIGDYGTNCQLATTWTSVFSKINYNTWVCSGVLALSGVSATERFCAYDTQGNILAYGDIDVNGGCNATKTARAIEGGGFEKVND